MGWKSDLMVVVLDNAKAVANYVLKKKIGWFAHANPDIQGRCLKF